MGRSVCIVGAGVVGLCTALELLDRGFEVRLVDREPEPLGGCSSGNAGMIVPSHFVPLAAPGMVGKGLRMWLFEPEGPFAFRLHADWALLRWAFTFARHATAGHVARSKELLRDLNLESRRLYDALAERAAGAFGLEAKGMLILCRTEAALHEESAAAEEARRLGLDARALSAAEAQALDPGWPMDVAGGVFVVEDAHLAPERLLAWLDGEVRRRGALVERGLEGIALEREGSRVTAVRTARGPIRTEEVVVAAGSWSARLLASAGLRLLLQSGKGYSYTLERPPRAPSRCAILAEARVAVTPMGDRLRFGGTMEIGGLDGAVNRRRLRGLVRSIPSYFPAVEERWFDGQAAWSGLRPCSPDGLPYVGRWRGLANLTVATGHAMMGLSLAPVTGRLVGELLEGRPREGVLARLRPDRF